MYFQTFSQINFSLFEWLEYWNLTQNSIFFSLKIFELILLSYRLQNFVKLYLVLPIQARTRNMSAGENVQKWTKRHHAVNFSNFYRVLATSMTQRRVENTCVLFWTFSPVSVKPVRGHKIEIKPKIGKKVCEFSLE